MLLLLSNNKKMSVPAFPIQNNISNFIIRQFYLPRPFALRKIVFSNLFVLENYTNLILCSLFKQHIVFLIITIIKMY